MSDFVIKDGVLMLYCGNEKEIVIPTGVTKIDAFVFSKYFLRDNNITSVIIPDGVTEIGEGAFSGCEQLKNTSLPKTLKRVDPSAFYNTPISEENLQAEKSEIVSAVNIAFQPTDAGQAEKSLISRSDMKKVMLLEDAILNNDIETAKRIVKVCAPFEFTARALGLACRFCTTDMIKLLLENGAVFDYKLNNNLRTKYYVSVKYNFELIPIIDLKCDIHLQDNFRNHLQDYNEFTPQEESVRLENVKYLCQALKAKSPERIGNMLFYAIKNAKDAFVKAIRESGGVLNDKDVKDWTDHNYKNLTDTLAYTNYMYGKDCSERILNHFLDAVSDKGEKLQMGLVMYREILQYSDAIMKRIVNECDLSAITPAKLLAVTMQSANAEKFAALVEAGYIKSAAARDKLIDQASKSGKVEHLAVLMDYKNRTADIAKESQKRQKKEMAELTAAPDSVAALKKIWSYEKNADGTLTITAYKGDLIDVIVPAQIGTNKVTAIGEEAFSPQKARVKNKDVRSKISSVSIPNGVTDIGDKAFEHCRSLENITLSNSVISIGSSAFEECTGLMSITLSDNVMRIGDAAFKGCTGLMDITIPDSVTSIGDSVFSECTGLTSITIGSGITDMDTYIFNQCSNLCSISVSENNDVYRSVNGVVFDKNMTSLIKYPQKKPEDTYEIPDGITSIGDYAFWSCTGLTSITIPDSVTSIGSAALRDCTGLTGITIPDSVTSIKQHAFWGCTGLTSVIIPDGVTNIDDCAFYNCTGLTSVTIPDGVTNIGSMAFYNCTGLTSIILPNGLTGIGSYAFDGCSELTTVTLPYSLTSIGLNGFGNCEKLANVYISDIGAYLNINFGNSYSNPMYYANNLYINDEIAADVLIPDTVTALVDYAFYNCTGLTNVTLPESLISVGNYAFGGCTGLTSIILPDSVTSIGNCAFIRCTGLTSLTLPKNVTSVGERAFCGCTNLTGIALPESVASIGIGAFDKCSNLANVYISNIEAYLNIDFAGSTSCPLCYADNLYINNELTTELEIPNTVKAIPHDAFYGCTGLIKVIVQNGVKKIGDSAFAGCTGLTSVILPNGLTKIDDFAFSNCSSLESITLPNNLTAIGFQAFRSCKELTSIIIPSSLRRIGEYAFYEVNNLANIYYTGSEAEWCKIKIGLNNDALHKASVTYNYAWWENENKA